MEPQGQESAVHCNWKNECLRIYMESTCCFPNTRAAWLPLQERIEMPCSPCIQAAPAGMYRNALLSLLPGCPAGTYRNALLVCV